MEIDRELWSPLERQRKKLAYAQELIPHFERCREELGSFASLNKIAKWLTDQGIPTTPNKRGKAGIIWHASTVTSFLEIAGMEPTDDLIKSALQHDRSRKHGFRVTILRAMERSRQFLIQHYGQPEADKAQSIIEAHCAALLKAEKQVKRALGKK